MKNHNFGALRSIFFPLKRDELAVFFPLALIASCFLCNFGLLRSLKDSLIVPTIGAEVIGILKLWFVMPSAILITITYIKLNNSFNIKNIYYFFILIFSFVFLIFGFFLYPDQDFFHPSKDFLDKNTLLYPNLKWIIRILGKWSYAIIYIFSDLWSAVIINLIFWQFVNQTTDTEVAKRFYPTMGLVGNIGLVIAGLLLIAFTSEENVIFVAGKVFFSENENLIDNNQVFVKLVITTVVVINCVSMFLFNFIYKKLIEIRPINQVALSEKTKLSVPESLKLISRSSYILNISVMVVCYYCAINILEGPWKDSIKKIYPEIRDYGRFMGKFNVLLGLSAVLFVFIGNCMFRFLEWSYVVFFSPIVIGITGVLFFGFLSFGEYIGLADNYIYIAMLIGSAQNVISKSSKYSVFDVSKEIAYIPLSLELKSKGKATVEIIGSKLGKSIGALIQSTIFIIFPELSFEYISKDLLCIFMIIISIWIVVVYKIRVEYSKINQ